MTLKGNSILLEFNTEPNTITPKNSKGISSSVYHQGVAYLFISSLQCLINQGQVKLIKSILSKIRRLFQGDALFRKGLGEILGCHNELPVLTFSLGRLKMKQRVLEPRNECIFRNYCTKCFIDSVLV